MNCVLVVALVGLSIVLQVGLLLQTVQTQAELTLARKDAENVHGELSSLRSQVTSIDTVSRSEFSATRAELTANRAEMSAVQTRVSSVEKQAPASAAPRQLQEAPDDKKDSSCLSSNSVSVYALDAASAVSDAFAAFMADQLPGLLAAVKQLASTVTQVDNLKQQISQTVAKQNKIESAVQGLSNGLANTEVKACLRATCADTPVGSSMCVPWGTPYRVDCLNETKKSQAFPVSSSNPPCCRYEWPATASVQQTSTKAPQKYAVEDIVVKIGATVVFTYIGFENVEQVRSIKPVSPMLGDIILPVFKANLKTLRVGRWVCKLYSRQWRHSKR